MFENIFTTTSAATPDENTITFLSIPIKTETVDKALLFTFSVFIAAAVVVALRIVFAGVVSMFAGLKKLLYFMYLTYSLVWKAAVTVLQLGIFIIVVAIVYYWFFENSLKEHLATLSALTPNSATIIATAQNNTANLLKFGKTYLGQQ